MRSIFITILASGVVLLLISSCATVPTAPLAPGELRLLSLETEKDVGLNLALKVKVFFEADARPEIRRACFTWSGDGLSCVKISQMEDGPPRSFTVWITPRIHGSFALECYAEYTRGGKAWPSNKVSTQVTVAPH
jgi:hypothetical protein